MCTYFSHTLALFVHVLLSPIHMLKYLVCICFFVQVLFVVDTHASYACISCTFVFLYKCFSSSIHMLLMRVFHVHLLFCTSIFYRQYICFLCMYFKYTCFLCKYFFLSSIYMFLMHVFQVYLLFCASSFYRQYTCFLCMYFKCTCFFVQVFFRIVIWTMITSLRVFLIWKLKIRMKRIMTLAVLLLFRQHSEWKRLQ